MNLTTATALSLLICSAIAIPTLDGHNNNNNNTTSKTLFARQRNYNVPPSANDGQSANTDLSVMTYPTPNCQGRTHELITHVQYGVFHNYAGTAAKGSIQSIFLSRQINNNEQIDFFAATGTDGSPLPAHDAAVPNECQYFLYSMPLATTAGCYNIGEISPCWRFWLNPAYCSGGPDC